MRHIPLREKPHLAGPGIHRIYRFPNGYGASVVRFKLPGSFGGRLWGSYTDSDDEWEVAVIAWKGDDWTLTYSTPLTDDVIGHVADADLDSLLDRIAALPTDPSAYDVARGRRQEAQQAIRRFVKDRSHA